MPQTSTTNAGIPAGPHYADNLHLKVWSGEVLKTFNTETVMKSRIRTRSISSGSSAQFPAIGKAAAEYHQPGNVILGQDINAGEKVISIDDLLISSAFVSNWEEAVNHYETRSEYTYQMGDSLAQAYDQHLFAISTKACRDGTTGAVAEMGAATRDALGASPTLDDIIAALYDSAAYFDSTNIPKRDRVVFVTPDVYWDMVEDGRLLNKDFGNTGNQSKRPVLSVADMPIVASNNFALDFGSDSLSGSRGGSAHTEYDTDNSTGVALVMQKQALATVSLMDVATEREYQINRQGSLVVSKMAVGHGVLRPECLRLLDAAV